MAVVAVAAAAMAVVVAVAAAAMAVVVAAAAAAGNLMTVGPSLGRPAARSGREQSN
jgi:hypothetical protein